MTVSILPANNQSAVTIEAQASIDLCILIQTYFAQGDKTAQLH